MSFQVLDPHRHPSTQLSIQTFTRHLLGASAKTAVCVTAASVREVVTLSGQCSRRKSTQPGQGRLPRGSGWTEEPETAAPRRRQVQMPTFGSFQVPDADGARLGAGHDELLGGVEADTLHWGRVTCQALWRGGDNFSTLCGQILSCCLKFWGPRKCIREKRPKQQGHSQAPARTAEQQLLSAYAARAKSEPDPRHAASPSHCLLCS